MLKRRGLLFGLLATPFIARAELLMPVKAVLIAPPAPAFLPGDLVDSDFGWFRARGLLPHRECFIGARSVHRIEGNIAWVHNNSFGPQETCLEPVRIDTLKLFEGLPGNRVDNPSMRHRLISTPYFGFRYPEDPHAS